MLPFHRRIAALLVALPILLIGRPAHGADTDPAPVRAIRVLVWDERQPRQKEAYPDWLGNRIATHLASIPGLEVRSAALDDPDQGLSGLDRTDVLVWWGHVRQMEIEPGTARAIVDRIRSGRLGLIALHSAHWSRPFVEAMNERAREQARARLSPEERQQAVWIESDLLPRPLTPPRYTERLSPDVRFRKPIDGPVEVHLTLPNCCFPAYRGDGRPSRMHVLLPDHPIARGLPGKFEVPQTEMYDEPFHVPEPDAVVFEERWAGGEWFRSGCVWRVGSGRVFYFRPGHETYAVYDQPHVLRVVSNAALWLGAPTE